ncbi:MAG: haloacid dehalogenase-like hydrolase [Bacteroidales bacterium]|nr:haloacid dehalogenase-like hydrolase [Bacteroidales bacterium]
MSKKTVSIAIAYDFDGTLAPGNMQEHSFIPKLGIDNGTFWKEANERAKAHDMDEILAYMQLMLQKAFEKQIPITRRAFLEYGKQITFFRGVETFFDRINLYAAGRNASLSHYIISSGLRDIILGTKIAKHFTNIFASGFVFDINDVAVWPALAINYTSKTQYLFRINKGIINSWDNSTINKYVASDERPMPFSKMMYIGDGETDVPAMKMIKYQGGTAIAVYDPKKRKKKDKPSPKEVCEQLIVQKRADFIAPADYTGGSKLDMIIKGLIDRITGEENLKCLR